MVLYNVIECNYERDIPYTLPYSIGQKRVAYPSHTGGDIM